MNELRPNDYQFHYKQTLFGIVLTVRYAVPAHQIGGFEWGPWRKAEWYDMYLYKGAP